MPTSQHCSGGSPPCWEGTFLTVLFALAQGGPLGCLPWRARPWAPRTTPLPGGGLDGLPASNKCGPAAVSAALTYRVSPAPLVPRSLPSHPTPATQIGSESPGPKSSSPVQAPPPLRPPPMGVAATAEMVALEAKIAPTAARGFVPGMWTPASRRGVACPLSTRSGGRGVKGLLFPLLALSREVGLVGRLRRRPLEMGFHSGCVLSRKVVLGPELHHEKAEAGLSGRCAGQTHQGVARCCCPIGLECGIDHRAGKPRSPSCGGLGASWRQGPGCLGAAPSPTPHLRGLLRTFSGKGLRKGPCGWGATCHGFFWARGEISGCPPFHPKWGQEGSLRQRWSRACLQVWE